MAQMIAPIYDHALRLRRESGLAALCVWPGGCLTDPPPCEYFPLLCHPRSVLRFTWQVNALGVARGKHKQCGCQLAVLSLPQEERFKTGNILLPVMSRAKVYKCQGMSRVLCGVDSAGKKHDEPNFASDMRRLHQGVWIEIPDDERQGCTKTVRLRAWIIIVAADYLAAQSLLPTSESASAHVFCRACLYNSTHAAAGSPLSWHKSPAPTAGSCKSARRAFSLRTWPQLQSVLRLLAGKLSKAESERIMHDNGLNKLVFAFHPEFIPLVDPTNIAPQDILHLFPDGLLRHEGAWLVYILLKLGLKISEINLAIRKYRDWPSDVRIPDLHEGLSKGAKGGRPKSSAMLRMTGSQCMHFALHR